MNKATNLEKFSIRNVEKINFQIERILPRKFRDADLSKLTFIRYKLDLEAINKSINTPFWDLLDRGGKRWRPILFLLIVKLFGKNPDKYLDLSCIFELIHNATLIVDDIEDKSEKRRGKKSVHLIYGDDIAINSANTLYYLPLLTLKNHKDINTEKLLKIYQTYIQEMVNLGIGQGTDIAWHNNLVANNSITINKYFQMCAFKTGCLARMSAKIAAIIGGASDTQVDILGRLGESLGVVFQIQDDILNITESELSKLKGFGEDITEGKKSLPVLIAMDLLPKSKSKRLADILKLHSKDPKIIKEAVDLINLAEGIEKSQVKMRSLLDETLKEIEKNIPKNEAKEQLLAFAKSLVDRKI